MDGSQSFIRTIIRQCGDFFQSLHDFCVEYENNLDKKLPPSKRRVIPITKKSPKQPGEKRRIGSSYVLYFRERAKELKDSKQFADFDGRQLSTYIANEWKNLPADKREYYNNQYRKEMEIFIANRYVNDTDTPGKENRDKGDDDLDDQEDQSKEELFSLSDGDKKIVSHNSDLGASQIKDKKIKKQKKPPMKQKKNSKRRFSEANIENDPQGNSMEIFQENSSHDQN